MIHMGVIILPNHSPDPQGIRGDLKNRRFVG